MIRPDTDRVRSPEAERAIHEAVQAARLALSDLVTADKLIALARLTEWIAMEKRFMVAGSRDAAVTPRSPPKTGDGFRRRNPPASEYQVAGAIRSAWATPSPFVVFG